MENNIDKRIEKTARILAEFGKKKLNTKDTLEVLESLPEYEGKTEDIEKTNKQNNNE